MNSVRVTFIIGLVGLALALGWQAAPLYAASCATVQTDPSAPAPGPDRSADSADESHLVTLPAGSVISVRIADRIDSSHDHSGDLLTGIVDPSVLVGDHVVIPRTTEAHVRLVEDKKGGHLHGKAEVRLELISLIMNGRRLEVRSNSYQKKQGALSAKTKGMVSSEGGAHSGATQAANAAVAAGGLTSTATPAGVLAIPAIAVFRAARVQMDPGSRIAFVLTSPFTFEKPAPEASGSGT